jgi:hypothetical protein
METAKVACDGGDINESMRFLIDEVRLFLATLFWQMKK